MKKNILNFIFFLFSAYTLFGQITSCEVKSVCENDLLQNEEVITYFESNLNNNAQDSWYSLYLAGETNSRVNVEDLSTISSYLKNTSKLPEELAEEIIKNGGYAQWKLVNEVKSFKSIEDLYSQFSSIIGNKGLKHIFRGEINSSGLATGVHHISAVRSGSALIVEETIEPLVDGFYKAKVKVSDGNGGWIIKDDKSTFFPDAWDEVKVMSEIKSARDNMIGTPMINTNSKLDYFGLSNSGHRIRIIRQNFGPDMNITTAWFE